MSSSAPPLLPLGISDFRQLREAGALYVDKTDFVTQVLHANAQVVLIPRPRRFGKTVNLSTVRYFVERSKEDRTALFEGLSVWGSAEARKHYQRYPVISLSFKDVKGRTFDKAFAAIRHEIRGAYQEHAYLLDEGVLRPWDAPRFQQILNGEGPQHIYQTALLELSRHLAQYHGERVFILIDEYDTPIHAAAPGEDELDMLEFFRAFLSAGLKDNVHLARGLLTGILRIAKESLFSGLNNLAVYSLIRTECATSFGFTEAEVRDLAVRAGAEASIADLTTWYNGYRFGGQVVYNPWSILSFLASEDKVLRPYWVHTSSDDLLRRIIFAHGIGREGELEVLLAGGEIEKIIDDRVALRELDDSPDAVWSFLLFTGYLKATSVRMDDTRTVAALAVPNKEVHHVYETIFRSWLSQRLGGSGQVEELHRAILSGDAEACERLLGQLLQSLSVHDVATRPGAKTSEQKEEELTTDIALTRVTPEQVYHVFVVSLLLGLQPRYTVRSNRESGAGRYDVMISPRTPGQPGVVMELKVKGRHRRESVESAMAAALGQIRERDYAAELRACGAEPIHEMGIVFDAKRAWVEVARPPAPRKPSPRGRPAVAKRSAPKKKAAPKKTPAKKAAPTRAAPRKKGAPVRGKKAPRRAR